MHDDDRAPGSGRRITGVLHAGAVSDRHLPVVIFPDDGSPAVVVRYRTDQASAVRISLGRRITIDGIATADRGGADHLELDRIEPTPQCLPRRRQPTVDPPAGPTPVGIWKTSRSGVAP